MSCGGGEVEWVLVVGDETRWERNGSTAGDTMLSSDFTRPGDRTRDLNDAIAHVPVKDRAGDVVRSSWCWRGGCDLRTVLNVLQSRHKPLAVYHSPRGGNRGVVMQC